jgi:cation transport ATPase
MTPEKYFSKKFQVLDDPWPERLQSANNFLKLSSINQLVFTTTSLFQHKKTILKQYFAIQDQTLATKEYILQIAGSIGAQSGHPNWVVLGEAARENGVGLREIELEKNLNCILGHLDRTWYVLGNQEAIQQENIELGMATLALVAQIESDGSEVIFLAQKQPKRLLGIFALERKITKQCQTSFQALKELDLEIIILTHQKTRLAKALAQPLGISLIHSELSDKEKQEIIQILTLNHPKTALVASEMKFYKNISENLIFSPDHNPKNQHPNQISYHDLSELPGIIQKARKVAEDTKNKFFWCKIR